METNIINYWAENNSHQEERAMDSKIPYLDAIQKIPGSTPKEKYQAQYQVIKQVAENKKASGDFSLQIGSSIPEKLIPLITTEIAKILKNADDVIAALKSDDFTIVNRALQAEWMFDGSNKTVTNYPYFATHILPEVSLNTRNKIIKLLSQHLTSKREYKIAQEFFEGILKASNLKEAMPLLTACSEDYILEFIKDEKILLPTKMVMRMFSMYPELVIKYLKSREKKWEAERNHRDILPRLIKNYINDFISICKSTYCSFSLGKKLTELFLKREVGTEALIQHPSTFLDLVTLELATNRLNKEQFEVMFRNLFPEKQDDFSFDCMLKYLAFQPEELKLPLMKKNFKMLYGVDLITVLNKVTVQLMLMLPEKDRVDVAQKKLAVNPNLNRYRCTESWICYLSTKDSIPQIKDQLSKSRKMDYRADLVEHLIYTCKVNKSEKDLLLLLEYFLTEHHNEIPKFWFKLYDFLLEYFDLALLSANHWIILKKMIERSSANNGLLKNVYTSEKLLVKAIHYNLLNNIPIEDSMTMLTEFNIKFGNSDFDILSNYPVYQKQCLETFVDIISRKFLEDYTLMDDKKNHSLTACLLKALYEYNKKMIEVATKKQKVVKTEELFSFTHYSWLSEIIENILLKKGKQRSYQYYVDEIKSLVRCHERKLYDSWFPPKYAKTPLCEPKGLCLLKREPSTILENWEAYLESCKENINSYHTKRFLRKCVWYKEIPIKFAQECLKNVDKGDSRSLMILALLLEGAEVVRIIEPMMPVSGKMEIDGEEAKKSFCLTSSVPPAINVMNPPPSLELVSRFFQGDYVALGLTCLMNVARRIPVNKIIEFVTALVDKPISVKKHGIRLMCFVASPAEVCEFLTHAWKTEKHKSIRQVIFERSYKLLTDQPCDKTWNLMRLCIEGLTPEDVECIQKLKKLEVPLEYIPNFFKITLNKIEKLGDEGYDKTLTIRLMCSLLRDVRWSEKHFPEEYCRFLVRKFAFDFSLDPRILVAGQSYAISFLRKPGDILESRLTFFYDFLETAISNDWNKPHPENLRYYPMRKFLRKIVKNTWYWKVFMNLFSSVLEPAQDLVSFLNLFFPIQYQNADKDVKRFGLLIGQELPKLIELFSAEMLVRVSNELFYFVNKSEDNNLKITSLIEVLLEIKSNHCATVAAVLFVKSHEMFPDKNYKDIVEKLRKINYPAITFLLNRHNASLEIRE